MRQGIDVNDKESYNPIVPTIVRPCPDSLDCPADVPLDNFSSEGDDGIDFISTVYKYIDNKIFNRTECGVTYVSTISQADADLHAAAASCPPCLGAGCDGPTTTTFCNAPQNPCVPCPDGSTSCFNVPGGLFCGFLNQASADSAAFQYGLQQARNNILCLGSIPSCSCVGQAYSGTVTAPEDVMWTLSGGSLPPGLSIDLTGARSAIIGGIPNTPGQFAFQLKAATQAGNFTTRTYVISVIMVSTVSLPPFTIGVPYSFQLQATGGSGNYSWRVASGTLPAGLTMSITGLISGTPQ